MFMAFDTMNQDLLTAKSRAYGFHKDALSFMNSYLTKRRPRVRVNYNFSAWEGITSRVPQGSILAPLFFNIFLNALLLFVENSDLNNYAAGNTLYSCGTNLEEVKQTLREEFQKVTKWSHCNSHIFLSSQVKRSVIISNKHGIYELPHKLPNDLTPKRLYFLMVLSDSTFLGGGGEGTPFLFPRKLM